MIINYLYYFIGQPLQIKDLDLDENTSGCIIGRKINEQTVSESREWNTV